MVKAEAEAWAAELRKAAAPGMVLSVIELPEGGWWVEQDCTEEFAREIYRKYPNETLR